MASAMRTIYFPLPNFEMETPEEIELKDATIHYGVPQKLTRAVAGNHLIWSRFYMSALWEDEDLPRRSMDRCIHRLRLINHRSLVIPSTVYAVDEEKDTVSIDQIPHYVAWKIETERPLFLIKDETEIRTMEEEWLKFAEIPLDSFALRRTLDAELRPFIIDRVVDYNVALESLMMLEGEEGSHLIRRRGAHIVSKLETELDREALRDRFYLLYHLRCLIVHGTPHRIRDDFRVTADSPVGWEIILNWLRDQVFLILRWMAQEDPRSLVDDDVRRSLFESAGIDIGRELYDGARFPDSKGRDPLRDALLLDPENQNPFFNKE